MIEFFKGWRRKLGVMTLLVACVFMGGWARSLSFTDKAAVPISQSASVEFFSMRSKFCLTRFSHPPEFEWKSSPIENATNHPIDLLTANWSMRLCGVRLFTDLHAYGDKTAGILVPYWMLAVPLTLISLWVLLSKPRQSTQKKSVEPTANERGGAS